MMHNRCISIAQKVLFNRIPRSSDITGMHPLTIIQHTPRTVLACCCSYASGSKPAAKNTIKLSNVPNIAAQTPVGSTARGAGVSASLQAATASAINNRINAQVQVAAHNAMPGPNIPGPKP
jgi:hypothetical protein